MRAGSWWKCYSVRRVLPPVVAAAERGASHGERAEDVSAHQLSLISSVSNTHTHT